MIRTQVQVEDDQMEWLKSRAKEQGVSVSKLFRESVKLYIKAMTKPPKDKKKRAMRAIGKFSSGKTDVSVKHDSYLTDTFSEVG